MTIQEKPPWAPLLGSRETWSEIDEALFGPQNLFEVEAVEAERLRLAAIQRSVRYHFERNRFYRTICKERAFQPQDVEAIEDLRKVPLVPDTIFKGYSDPSQFARWLEGLGPDDLEYPPVHNTSSYDSVMDELHYSEITVMYSSGTSGRFTFVPRDELTWRRARYAIGVGTLQLIPGSIELLSSPENSNLLLLMPHPKRTHIFLGRAATAGFDLFSDAKIYAAIDRSVSTTMLRLSQGHARGLREKVVARIMREIGKRTAAKADDRMIRLMSELAKARRGGLLAGPPFWVLRILSKIEKTLGSFSLGDNWFVLTAGGWKMQEFARVSEKEFTKRVSKILGVPESNIRDIYGMAECNVVFPSCEGHYKHVPNTVLQPFVLDENLEPVGYGVAGRFAFLDPLAKSYPSFVITGDRAKVLEHCPACSRSGPVIDNEITRMPGVEDRGCANVMRSFVEGEVSGA